MSTKDTSGSTPQHSHPHNNTMSRNEKFWVDQVTVPQPPPGNDKGWGTTRGGGGAEGKGGRGVGVSVACIGSQHTTGSRCGTDQGSIVETRHTTELKVVAPGLLEKIQLCEVRNNNAFK